ncbi:MULTISPECIES: MFS transporter [Streptomyces]|uniref:MFS transporter n=1 Tax=Streptomyces koelreuteriae TaxID=2838015 RepID=A0ABX8FWV9_9ACTN|nr:MULTISPECIES: MFS transporter [Streptomyces]QWB25688.1 MFS transporter [Streptomyces koelreuteriae]UUA08743.1 MFS transporter [Streptomyces koelreuteriae]UUA16348.1 MFS transporter [Streptomyces sp. CRCS-T-1]
MFAPRTTPWSLVALFTAGYLAPYLLPTTVGRLDSGLPLSATQAGAVGSALLLSSAAAGFVLASRVERIGARTLARIGLALALIGYGGAALTTTVPAVVAGAVLGGFGSGTATTVAATLIAGQRDPHRASTAGLLTVSALAGAVYLTVPHLGPGHGLPLAAIALTALVVWPLTGRLPARVPAAPTRHDKARLPHARSGLVLAAAMLCWSLAQNSLWGVSGRIGLDQAHLSEATVGAVFAVALGAGLTGVLAAGALGARLGRAVPIGAGTVLIAGCITLSASSSDLTSFATGEIAWNTMYPVVLSYLIGLAASLDPRGRWAVLVGSASSLGTAAGPLTGSVLSAQAGFPVMGAILAAGLLVIAVPMTAVALHTGGRPLLPGAIRRRGGHPAALVAAATGTPSGAVPEIGAPEQPVVEIPVEAAAIPTQRAYDKAGPRQAGASPGSGAL